MEKVIYRKTIVEGSKAEDGETATIIWLTEENNAYVIWKTSYEKGQELLAFFKLYETTKAIEEAVKAALKLAGEI